jgi:hypothetical protein
LFLLLLGLGVVVGSFDAEAGGAMGGARSWSSGEWWEMGVLKKKFLERRRVVGDGCAQKKIFFHFVSITNYGGGGGSSSCIQIGNKVSKQARSYFF